MTGHPLEGFEVSRMRARRDALAIVVVSVSAALLCFNLDLSETLLAWTRLHERIQLDEWPAVLLVVAVCLLWFSARRHVEARRQLEMRRVTEASLAEALAENQRLAQQYVDLQERERKALARDLHDELGQFLNVVKLDAVSIRDACGPITASMDAAARAIIDNVDRVYGVVSNLIRQLRPAGFDELGVAAALDYCLKEWRVRLPEAVIEYSIDAGVEDLDEARALALFRLVQESLTNAARHSQASRIDVRIAGRRGGVGDGIEARIRDNGRGTDLHFAHDGLGLIGMRERVAAFGGSLRLATRPGEGFEIVASLPFRCGADVPS